MIFFKIFGDSITAIASTKLLSLMEGTVLLKIFRKHWLSRSKNSPSSSEEYAFISRSKVSERYIILVNLILSCGVLQCFVHFKQAPCFIYDSVQLYNYHFCPLLVYLVQQLFFSIVHHRQCDVFEVRAWSASFIFLKCLLFVQYQVPTPDPQK